MVTATIWIPLENKLKPWKRNHGIEPPIERNSQSKTTAQSEKAIQEMPQTEAILEYYRRELSPLSTLENPKKYSSPIKGVYNRKGLDLATDAQGDMSLLDLPSNRRKRR